VIAMRMDTLFPNKGSRILDEEKILLEPFYTSTKAFGS